MLIISKEDSLLLIFWEIVKKYFHELSAETFHSDTLTISTIWANLVDNKLVILFLGKNISEYYLMKFLPMLLSVNYQGPVVQN